MGQEGLACSSMQVYLSGNCQLQIAANFHDPHGDQMPCLNQALKRVKDWQQEWGDNHIHNFQITPSILCKLKECVSQATPPLAISCCWQQPLPSFLGSVDTEECENRSDA